MVRHSAGPDEQVPPGIWILVVLGLLPLVTCVGLVVAAPAFAAADGAAREVALPDIAWSDMAALAVQAFIAYVALMLSFLGGARWGAELVRVPRAPSIARLVAAMLPPVIGLAALVPWLTSTQAIGLLMACGLWQLLWDVAASRSRLLPSWNARVRTVVTVVGTVCGLLMVLLKPA